MSIGVWLGMTLLRVRPERTYKRRANLEKRLKPNKSIKCSGQVPGSAPLRAYMQPVVNRQPGYRWGDSDNWLRPQNLKNLGFSDPNEYPSGRKSEITGTWAPRKVLTKQQGLDQQFVRHKSGPDPARHDDLTSGYGDLKENMIST